MSYEPYMDMVALTDLSVFQFISEGPRGSIVKQITITKTDQSRVYFLQLGDLTEYGRFNRATISNNGDMDRILATVILAIDIYTETYPNRWIEITSVSQGRVRLFRMAIGANLKRLSAVFTIRSKSDGCTFPFKKDRDSHLFEFRRKKMTSGLFSGKLEGQSRLFKKPISIQLNNRMEVKYPIAGKGAFLETDERHRRPKKEAVSKEKQTTSFSEQGSTVKPIR
jgi:hypothetical protein